VKIPAGPFIQIFQTDEPIYKTWIETTTEPLLRVRDVIMSQNFSVEFSEKYEG
jgi:hypothetical protein